MDKFDNEQKENYLTGNFKTMKYLFTFNSVKVVYNRKNVKMIIKKRKDKRWTKSAWYDFKYRNIDKDWISNIIQKLLMWWYHAEF